MSHSLRGDRRLRTAGVDVAWRGLVLALDVLGMELKTHTYKLLMVLTPSLRPDAGKRSTSLRALDDRLGHTSDEQKVANSSERTLSCLSRSAVKCATADAISGVPVRGRRRRKREGTGVPRCHASLRSRCSSPREEAGLRHPMAASTEERTTLWQSQNARA